MFEDAGKYFFRGDIDPRLLVGYYPELRGSLLNVTDSINIFAGVEEYMPHESSVDDISKYHFADCRALPIFFSICHLWHIIFQLHFR
jgi:hypothetical protein